MSAEAHTRYRWPVRLILLGLTVELLSFFGLHHPLGFLVFSLLGCTALVAGITLFVAGVLRRGEA